jgi:hypothetical protein
LFESLSAMAQTTKLSVDGQHGEGLSRSSNVRQLQNDELLNDAALVVVCIPRCASFLAANCSLGLLFLGLTMTSMVMPIEMVKMAETRLRQCEALMVDI